MRLPKSLTSGDELLSSANWASLTSARLPSAALLANSVSDNVVDEVLCLAAVFAVSLRAGFVLARVMPAGNRTSIENAARYVAIFFIWLSSWSCGGGGAGAFGYILNISCYDISVKRRRPTFPLRSGW